jgi:amino acid permease
MISYLIGVSLYLTIIFSYLGYIGDNDIMDIYFAVVGALVFPLLPLILPMLLAYKLGEYIRKRRNGGDAMK